MNNPPLTATLPPFYLGALLLFWGAWVDLLPVGIGLALLAEGHRLVATRFALTFNDYRRVWQVSSILFVGGALVLLNEEGAGRFYLLLTWLPAIFFPVVAARLYGAAERLDAAVFSLLFARRRPEGEEVMIDPLPLYGIMTLLATTSANPRSPLFLITLSGMIVWGVARVRREGRTVLRTAMLVAAFIVGYGGALGLELAQGRLSEVMEEWYKGFYTHESDPFRAGTMIGQIGNMKFSGRIIYRVIPERDRGETYLLPQAMFDIYRRGTWLIRKASFDPIPPDETPFRWVLPRAGTPQERLRVMATFGDEKGLLLGGPGALAFENLPAASVAALRLGQVEGEDLPGFVTYDLIPGATLAPPIPDDTKVDGALAPPLDRFMKEAAIFGATPAETANRLVDHFHRRFGYTLDLTGGPGDPLVRFLTVTKEGHCEYFATAATLLLRRAGIPARYVVGYVAAERSWLEGGIVVRDRDAHAWTVAWIDGKWRTIDATPPAWMIEERAMGKPWEGLSDITAWIGRLLKQLRWGAAQWRTPLMIVGALLAAFLLFRVAFGARRREAETTDEESFPLPLQGGDSPFYRIIERYADRPLAMREEETILLWIGRLEEGGEEVDELRRLARLHYRFRFDPIGLSEAESGELARQVDVWLSDREPVAAPEL